MEIYVKISDQMQFTCTLGMNYRIHMCYFVLNSLAEGIPKRSQLIQRLIAYWTLKRQYRNGVPLLRRLQSSHPQSRPPPLGERSSPTHDSELRGEMYRQLKYWQCLRQDLERARLLCELVRKREKLKKELFKV